MNHINTKVKIISDDINKHFRRIIVIIWPETSNKQTSQKQSKTKINKQPNN